MAGSLVEVRNLHTAFRARKRIFRPSPPLVKAVDGVTMDLREGEILGLVGESGCGKSTLARTILGLQREAAGEILLDGQLVSDLPSREARRVRRDIQYVHQDPGAALDPWWRIGASLDETLKIGSVNDASERAKRIGRMIEAVGLDAGFLSRYPHELSGGQQRRVGLARILGLQPRVVILDEPTSGLDLSVQATVLRLMRDLRARFGLTYLFISHDLSVVRRMCDRVGIMYLGRIVEIGSADEIFANPRHPYTRALLAAAPRLEPGQLDETKALDGDPPSAARRPTGCAFHTRCDYARPSCAVTDPQLETLSGEHAAACLRLDEIGPVLPATKGEAYPETSRPSAM